MKKTITIFLQGVVVLIGISALIFMLWEPHVEGRNVNATVFAIYFKDPFLAYAYVASIFFFVATYHVFKLLGYFRANTLVSREGIRALRAVQYCAVALIAFVLGAEAYIFTVIRGKDDIAGGVAMGLFVILISVVVAIVAAIFKKGVTRRLLLG